MYIALLSRQKKVLRVVNVCWVKVARGEHILLKFAQAVLNMEVDRGETVCRPDEVSRGKDARCRREIVR